MSSDEEDVILYYYVRRRRLRQKQKRRFWVHPYIQRNLSSRLFIAARELSENDTKFQSVYRMGKRTFEQLVEITSPIIQRRNTNMRECVPAEERILITLR